MVATTFAADTPLAVTGFVRGHGIWYNWFGWHYVLSQMLAVFLFSRFWRRAEVLTDNELIELRYSGRPAAFLRGFKAGYFALLYNFIVLGWVLKGMGTIAQSVLGVDPFWSVVGGGGGWPCATPCWRASGAWWSPTWCSSAWPWPGRSPWRCSRCSASEAWPPSRRTWRPRPWSRPTPWPSFPAAGWAGIRTCSGSWSSSR